jgi:hemerythrin-like domain-containing protein
MNVSSLKETIAEAISKHVSLEDTYTYELKRAKSAFEVGTMSLEDFEEWSEENVNDLAKSIVNALQPQLNENQHVVFDWAKSYLSEAKNIMWFIEELAFLSTTGGKMRYKQVAYTYESLSDKEKRELLSALMAWALEQEAE